jgi:toxin ParE1/3/4
MTRYVVSPQSRTDMKEICQFIARDSRLAAGRIRRLFYEKFKFLARHPLVGQARPELGADLRSFSAGNYVIFFRPITDGIQVVRVLHGSRDITAIFDVEG